MKADTGIQERIGHLAATLPGEGGYVCYRSFAATPSYLERNPDTAQRFVNGYGRARRWVEESAAAAVAECIADVFPDYSHDVLAESVRRYQAAGVWMQVRASAGRATTGCAMPSSPAAWRGAVIPAKVSCARSLRNGPAEFRFRWFSCSGPALAATPSGCAPRPQLLPPPQLPIAPLQTRRHPMLHQSRRQVTQSFGQRLLAPSNLPRHPSSA